MFTQETIPIGWVSPLSNLSCFGGRHQVSVVVGLYPRPHVQGEDECHVHGGGE